jgi:hypothetical protein
MDRLNERLAIVGKIIDASAGTGTGTSDVIDMKNFKRCMFVLQAGTIAAGGLIDMAIQEGTSTTSFNTATAVKDMTQLINTDDNKVAIVEVMDEDMTDQYRYLRAVVSRTVGNSITSLLALAGDPHYQPASQFDLAAVKQIENA